MALSDGLQGILNEGVVVEGVSGYSRAGFETWYHFRKGFAGGVSRKGKVIRVAL
jgi:hypothetical protein